MADNTITSGSDETAPLPGHTLTPMPAKSASTQTQITLVSPISSEQPAYFINDTEDEQINSLNAEVKALISFIVEQLYVIKVDYSRLNTLSVKKAYQIAQILYNPLKKN